MSIYEIVYLFIAGLALIVSMIAFVGSRLSAHKANGTLRQANELIKGQVEIQKGQVEIEIRNMISSARNSHINVSVQLDEKPESEVLRRAAKAALEDVLNAYEEACGKYLDTKVDKERFKKNYEREIRNLVEHEATRQHYIMPQSSFQATVRVYQGNSIYY